MNRGLVLSICAAMSCVVSTSIALPGAPAASGTPAFRVRTFRFVDSSRTIPLPSGRHVPRPVQTIVRYPTTRAPHPLIVFGHGYALTPATYSRLLDAWAEDGLVVAAPVFPLGNANAPGGPRESDLDNQPRDMSFVISRLVAMNGHSRNVLTGMIDPSRIAVAGHSDGGVTALAVAYDRRFRDMRVRAAIVMSGAALPGMGRFPAKGPPLLALQGTADAINAPATTAAFFERAHRPKFLLWLLGASHRPPYTDQEPQLSIVERATVAFLDHYLRGSPLRAFDEAAQRRGLTHLLAQP